jgi:hypothetical protein
MMLCVVCTVHKKIRSASFLVWPQNQGIPFVSGLTSKSLGRVSQFGPQNRQLRFDDLGLKITATVSWFESKKNGLRFISCATNPTEDEDSVGHVSRFSGLICLKTSWARVFQSGLKTDEGVAQIVHVTSLQRLCRAKVEDGWVDMTGCIELFYLNFIVFIVLAHKDILVFCLGL